MQRIVAKYTEQPVNCRIRRGSLDCVHQECPSLDLMRQDAREKRFDILYVYDRGRLARKFVYQEIVIEELANLDITFKSLHDINGKTPEE